MAAYPLHSSHRRKDIRNWNGENLEVNTPHTLTEELYSGNTRQFFLFQNDFLKVFPGNTYCRTSSKRIEQYHTMGTNC